MINLANGAIVEDSGPVKQGSKSDVLTASKLKTSLRDRVKSPLTFQ